ncbi:amidohydrolase family protein, partial [Nonomuraea antimicrobica]|uniref:amidohydrolase family protein n=1 Tax=Nonomuraea antimicrobica TaxID=561173 RepID=UPI0031E94C4C
LGLRPRGLDRRLVEAATLGGARALGMDRGRGRIGALTPGARADFAVYDARGRYPYAALLAQPPCLGTVVGGTVSGTDGGPDSGTGGVTVTPAPPPPAPASP